MTNANLQQSARQETAAALGAMRETHMQPLYAAVQRPCNLSIHESASEGACAKAIEVIPLQQTADQTAAFSKQ